MPVDLLGHILFSIHMTQIAVLLLVIARCYYGNPSGFGEVFEIKVIDVVFGSLQTTAWFNIIHFSIFGVSFTDDS